MCEDWAMTLEEFITNMHFYGIDVVCRIRPPKSVKNISCDKFINERCFDVASAIIEAQNKDIIPVQAIP